MSPLEQKVFEITAPLASDLGLRLLNIKINGADGAQTVQVIAENPKTKRLGIDDCAKLSRELSAHLDVEDPITGKYRLEVSSPGIDRELFQEEDFEVYQGHEAKIETTIPAENGQKRFRGFLKGIQDGQINLATDQGDVEISFDALKKAKLVLTDRLIKETATL